MILNPWWEVPKSIEHEAAGKKGFVPVKGADGKIQRWRQPPGPTNALGQVKFVMPNSKASTFTTPTPAAASTATSGRSATAASARSTSSISPPSCWATTTVQWTPDKIQAALDSKKTVQANFVKPLPVYIVYFSSAALLDGKIVDYKDLYGRDAKALAALQMKDGGASLARKKPADRSRVRRGRRSRKPSRRIGSRPA